MIRTAAAIHGHGTACPVGDGERVGAAAAEQAGIRHALQLEQVAALIRQGGGSESPVRVASIGNKRVGSGPAVKGEAAAELEVRGEEMSGAGAEGGERNDRSPGGRGELDRIGIDQMDVISIAVSQAADGLVWRGRTSAGTLVVNHLLLVDQIVDIAKDDPVVVDAGACGIDDQLGERSIRRRLQTRRLNGKCVVSRARVHAKVQQADRREAGRPEGDLIRAGTGLQ